MAAEEELAAPLELFPPVEFCCAYGSALLHKNNDKEAMVDYILGVADPMKWHEENLERNRQHYAKWMAFLGPKTINCVANRVGVGVYFNPFVRWKQKIIKYGIVGMQDLSRDLLVWERFYIAGRLQKPVHILVDNYGIAKVNAVNLKAAVTAALLLSTSEFTEVKKIVQGSFSQFQALYRPFISGYIAEGLLKPVEHQKTFKQDCGLSATMSLFSSLPEAIQSRTSPEKLNLSLDRDNERRANTGCSKMPLAITSREEAASCTRQVLRHSVMISSARQAAAGILTAGGVNAVRYVGRKILKAWSS